jgi:hypothetical protein
MRSGFRRRRLSKQCARKQYRRFLLPGESSSQSLVSLPLRPCPTPAPPLHATAAAPCLSCARIQCSQPRHRVAVKIAVFTAAAAHNRCKPARAPRFGIACHTHNCTKSPARGCGWGAIPLRDIRDDVVVVPAAGHMSHACCGGATHTRPKSS